MVRTQKAQAPIKKLPTKQPAPKVPKNVTKEASKTEPYILRSR